MSKTILSVDDSKTMRRAAEISFLGTGYELVTAESADDGLAEAKKNKPGLILADAVMPGTNGYDFCKSIKADPDLAGIPVIMVCGNSEAYDEAKGSEAGCDGHITKPWDSAKLIAKIGEFVAAGAKPAPATSTTVAPPGASANTKTMMGVPAMTAPAAAAAVASGTGSSSSDGTRDPMIAGQPTKPIRLVLASQVESNATSMAAAGGLSSADASNMTETSREVIERVAWEVVPELAEAIIRENLETLTSKAG